MVVLKSSTQKVRSESKTSIPLILEDLRIKVLFILELFSIPRLLPQIKLFSCVCVTSTKFNVIISFLGLGHFFLVVCLFLGWW